VSESKLQKLKGHEKKGESLFFVLVFAIIGMLLFAADAPFFMLLFFGGFSYLIYKIFKKPTLGGSRDIFEFYLSANDILRDDDRKWFGFEIQDILIRGERILQTMPDPPPLLNFALGALYNKIGGHKSAIEHLSFVAENEQSDESLRSVASPQLRSYVKILRKIEQNPSEAPLTSAAIRSLERARRNRVTTLLEQSRREIWQLEERRQSKLEGKSTEKSILQSVSEESLEIKHEYLQNTIKPKSDKSIAASVTQLFSDRNSNFNEKKANGKRQTISEVLHEVYDKKNR
jgi:hypothetical protein